MGETEELGERGELGKRLSGEGSWRRGWSEEKLSDRRTGGGDRPTLNISFSK